MDIKAALARVVGGSHLTSEEMHRVMMDIMTGKATEAQIGGFLVALRMKGEVIDEILGAAQVMRQLATPVQLEEEFLVDTCGTGGDGANLFNVSTAAAFVASAAGAKVAKHGNRSVSSSTGSADLLEKAGVNLTIAADKVARSVAQIGVGFMFAPAHHNAMKYAIGPRKQLGMRTIFNLLGPLTNPAGVKRQVIGVFEKSLCRPLAEVLGKLGSEHVLVVHAKDGLDEFSIAQDSYVAELKHGQVTEFVYSPDAYDYENLDGLSVANSEESLDLITRALRSDSSERAKKARSLICLNAGAAIYVAGVALTLDDGISMADDAVASGLAYEKMKELAEFSNL